MKRIWVLLALATVSLMACRVSNSTKGPVTELKDDSEAIAVRTLIAGTFSDIPIDDRRVFASGLVASERAVLDALPGATTYQIEMEISDDLLSLKGRETVRYTNRESESLEGIYFRLFPNVAGGEATVSDVTVAGRRVDPVNELSNSAVRLPLPAALGSGEQVMIQMDFKVRVPQDMGGNYGLFGFFDGVLVLDKFYPVIPVYDDEGWNVEVPPPNGDLSYYDAGFYLVRVAAPAELEVVTSGVEVGRERKGDSQVLTIAAGPARDFYIAASDRYTIVGDKVGGTTVNAYAFEEHAEGAKLALRHTVDALESFNRRFGVYPYTELDVVGTPMQALGSEYPGTVAISLELLDPDGVVWGLPAPVLLEGTVAHEVAHQWFYNVVGNDQVDEPWLDEAIVQYATERYYLDTQGAGAAQGFSNSWYERWDRVDRADIAIGLTSGAYTGLEYGAIVYGRGPIFVAALAEEMGQKTFDGFFRDYYESYKWGVGTGSEFRRLAESRCRCDLTALFEEWVYPQ